MPHPIKLATALRDVGLQRMLAAFVAIHVAMLVVTGDVQRKLVLGDRAGDRLRNLEELARQPDWDNVLRSVFRIGSVGDYILFWPAYSLGGAAGLVVQGLMLSAIGLVGVFLLATRLLPADGARIAAAVWMLLPATLFHPHALVTEAICNPVLILLVLTLVRLTEVGNPRLGLLLAAAGLTAILVLVRHVYLLLPFSVALWLWVVRPTGTQGLRRPLTRYIAVALSLLAVWWAAIVLGGGRYELGRSVGGLESNLYLRAERMAYLGQIPLPQSYLDRNARLGRDTRTLEPAEFLGMMRQRPDLFMKTAAADAFNMMVNPGVAMLFGRYLGLFDLGERTHRDLNRWRETREKEGFIGLARLLLATSPVGLLVNALGIAVWGVLLLAATIGAWRIASDALIAPALRWLMCGAAAYCIGLTSLTAGYTRWDHRSPIEFILAIAVASAVMMLRERQSGPMRLQSVR